MKRLGLATAFAGAFALAAACGGTNDAGPAAPGPASGGPPAPSGDQGTLPCSVDAVLAAKCRKCHAASPQFGAPMPLVTLADLHAAASSDPSKKVYELVAARIADDAKPMPPPPNPRLSDADRQTLTSWAGAGAPASNDVCTTPPPPSVQPTVACTPDLELAPASPWEMPSTAGDEYVCYGVEVTRPNPTHVTGFVPRIDNTRIVHHVVLYEADAPFGSTPQPCSAGGSLQWRMVSGWAPGGKGFEMPPEAGFALATGGSSTHYVVQVHYSNPQGLSGQKDTSGMSLCTAPPRPNVADVLAFGTQTINMPPAADYVRDCSVKVPAQLAGVHFVAAMPHMHKLGISIATTLTPADGGAPVDLGTMNDFSFNTQTWLPISAAAPATATNDVITTRCEWMNTTGAPVSFGEKTADEMCYSFTVYYPKVESGLWSWALPALTSQCQ